MVCNSLLSYIVATAMLLPGKLADVDGEGAIRYPACTSNTCISSSDFPTTCSSLAAAPDAAQHVVVEMEGVQEFSRDLIRLCPPPKSSQQ